MKAVWLPATSSPIRGASLEAKILAAGLEKLWMRLIDLKSLMSVGFSLFGSSVMMAELSLVSTVCYPSEIPQNPEYRCLDNLPTLLKEEACVAVWPRRFLIRHFFDNLPNFIFRERNFELVQVQGS